MCSSTRRWAKAFIDDLLAGVVKDLLERQIARRSEGAVGVFL